MLTTNSSENIEKLIKNVKGEENLIGMDDWNAIVGEEKVNYLTGEWDMTYR